MGKESSVPSVSRLNSKVEVLWRCCEPPPHFRAVGVVIPTPKAKSRSPGAFGSSARSRQQLLRVRRSTGTPLLLARGVTGPYLLYCILYLGRLSLDQTPSGAHRGIAISVPTKAPVNETRWLRKRKVLVA
ncbi:hypothetical protein CIB48_g8744 [Xylaria polymorpha]|nr:hypothetical protein CIB48_g8744 [Xylaria polymorpha]